MLKHVSDLGRSFSNRFVRQTRAGQSIAAENPAVDIREILRVVRRRFVLVAMIAVVALVAGWVYSGQLVPLYSATAKLLVNFRKTQVISSQEVVTGISGDHAAISSELELIKSTDVIRRVVRKLGLANRREFMSPVRPSLWQRLLGKAPAGKDNQLLRPSVGTDQSVREQRAIRKVQSRASVRRRGFTYVINIGFTSHDRHLAAEIANAIADEYLVDQLELKFEETRRANVWLNERLQTLRKKLRLSEQAVEQFKSRNNIVDNEGTTLSEQQITRLNERLILARAETAKAKSDHVQVRAARKRGGEIASFADQNQSAVINSLKSRISDVRRELATLQAKYGGRHPSVVAARAQLADYRRQLGAEVGRIVAGVENRYRAARSREASIETSIAKLKGRTGAATDSAEVRLRELKREASANRALFEAFLARFKEVSETETLQKQESRIIERATVPGGPISPNKRRIIFIFTLIGVLIGTAIAFLIERLDSGFRTTDEVEKMLGVPVLASLPRATGDVEEPGALSFLRPLDFITPAIRLLTLGKIGGPRRSSKRRRALARLVVEKPLAAFTEGIRSLRMGLKYAEIDHPPKVVMVTSSLPGEGKSTLASNLAQHAANSGENVLLIDMDLRHPVTSGIYGADAKVGLVQLILSEEEFPDVVRKDEATGLHIMPSPHSEELTHTAEILGSQRIRDILQQARELYDLVVVDTSPLLPVTDGRALIDAVDAVVMVIQWEETNREAVRETFRLVHGLEDKLVGVALNDVVAERARYYDYYKSGYYMKKYPYYYGTKNA